MAVPMKRGPGETPPCPECEKCANAPCASNACIACITSNISTPPEYDEAPTGPQKMFEILMVFGQMGQS